MSLSEYLMAPGPWHKHPSTLDFMCAAYHPSFNTQVCYIFVNTRKSLTSKGFLGGSLRNKGGWKERKQVKETDFVRYWSLYIKVMFQTLYFNKHN